MLRNTLGFSETYKQNGSSLLELAGVESFNGLPVLLYAGGIGEEKPFSRLVDAVFSMEQPVFFLAFCATTQKRFNEAQAYAEQKLSQGTYKICDRVKRADLLPVLFQADVGIVDYPYSYEKTWNQKFCAPTKLYEYMAAGLAVVGSDNDSLRKVVEDNMAGVCANSDNIESLAVAIDSVVECREKLMIMKKNARQAFQNKYSYEKCCYPVVDQLVLFLTGCSAF